MEEEVVYEEGNLESNRIVNDKSLYIEDDISDHVKDSFLKYSLAVIVDRALPDARDGLKPSHRRILYVLKNLNLLPGGKFRKSAKICGDTSGDFHPHGESVVYPTMVRMAQHWSMRYRLIDGQGNFGSVDGDSPGAMRYTEARMTKFTTYMLEDLDKDTVDMVSNYDETKKEPTVLPAKFPNLICNGSSGIAVGMSTYIPPHNLSEVIDAALLLLNNPDASIEEIMEVLPAPDFPTGGVICGLDGVRRAYETGRGKIMLQGSHEIETDSNDQVSIIVNEIPYGVNKSRLIERIAECIDNKSISEIADLRDESGRDGMRIVIKVKKGVSQELVLNKLYKITPLRVTIACHMLSLDKKSPKVMNIKQMLAIWIEHRITVIRRRTEFELSKALSKLHILKGFMKVLQSLDESIKIIRDSGDKELACVEIMHHIGLDKKQATAVLDMKLYRITSMEITKITSDYDLVKSDSERLQKILDNRDLIINIIVDQLTQIRMEQSKDKRMTRIERNWADIDSIESLIPNDPAIITLSKDGFVKRFKTDSFRTQKRGGQGIIGANDKRQDVVQSLNFANMHDYILIFTERGKCYWMKCWQIPELGRRSQGQTFANIIDKFDENDKVTTMLRMPSLDVEGCLVFCTRKGIIKKTAIKSFSAPRRGGIIAINLDEGDKVVNVQTVFEDQSVIIATRKGAIIRFNQSEIKEIGRSTRGVIGIRLKGDDFVVSGRAVNNDQILVFVSSGGFGKRTIANKIRETKRGGVGVKGMNCNKKTGSLISVLALKDTGTIVLSTKKCKMIKVSGEQIRVTGRVTQGVKLISLQDGDAIISSEVFEYELPITENVEEAQVSLSKVDA